MAEGLPKRVIIRCNDGISNHSEITTDSGEPLRVDRVEIELKPGCAAVAYLDVSFIECSIAAEAKFRAIDPRSGLLREVKEIVFVGDDG